tara:strand:- start:846 stop:1088 length:243 start_codon:yes stop_codon:yes gene_type:complete
MRAWANLPDRHGRQQVPRVPLALYKPQAHARMLGMGYDFDRWLRAAIEGRFDGLQGVGIGAVNRRGHQPRSGLDELRGIA